MYRFDSEILVVDVGRVDFPREEEMADDHFGLDLRIELNDYRHP
jgi:hypothetical protein